MRRPDHRCRPGLDQPRPDPARRGQGLPGRGQQGAQPAPAGGRGRPVLAAAVGRRWTAVSETSDHGYPIREHLARLLDGDIIWAPAIDGALLLSGRGGDYELRLGQDLSIGYLFHDAEHVELYFVESFTFSVYTTEASVAITA